MRSELRLFLWVTSFGLLAWALFHSAEPSAELSFGSDELGNASTAQYPVDIAVQAGSIRKDHFAALPEISSEQRNMFKVAPATAELSPTQIATPTELTLPILKGIVSQDGFRRAIFEDASASTGYAVVSRGERFGDLEIGEIGADYVIAERPDGSELTLKLRGAGETP